VILLSDQARRSHILDVLRLDTHEFLLKPTSPKALQDRLVLIIARPRPMVQISKFYVPKPCAGAAVPQLVAVHRAA
jgi:DNA-binding NarL/FixJ family response regulator